MTPCLFCKIAQKDIAAQIIYEDDDLLAFADIEPCAPQHYLLIPKQHIATLNDLTIEQIPLAGKLVYTAAQLAKELGIADSGYRIVNNCQAGAGQSVFHLHFHLLGDRPFHWPPG